MRGRLGFCADERSFGLHEVGGGGLGDFCLTGTNFVSTGFTACVSSRGAEIIALEMEGPALRRECAAPLTCMLCFARLEN